MLHGSWKRLCSIYSVPRPIWARLRGPNRHRAPNPIGVGASGVLLYVLEDAHEGLTHLLPVTTHNTYNNPSGRADPSLRGRVSWQPTTTRAYRVGTCQSIFCKGLVHTRQGSLCEYPGRVRNNLDGARRDGDA